MMTCMTCHSPFKGEYCECPESKLKQEIDILRKELKHMGEQLLREVNRGDRLEARLNSLVEENLTLRGIK